MVLYNTKHIHSKRGASFVILREFVKEAVVLFSNVMMLLEMRNTETVYNMIQENIVGQR